MIDALVVLSDHPRSNENETLHSGQHGIGACVTAEKQERIAPSLVMVKSINAPLYFATGFIAMWRNSLSGWSR